MYELKNFELEKDMDSAYHYLAYHLSKSGHNSKPVLMHSIAISTTLYHLGYSKNIVLAAILHDLIEDTDVSYEDINNHFGKEIADIVQAVSFNPLIENKIERTDEVFTRIEKQGYEAKIVKCADLYNNLFFLPYAKSNLKDYLIYKYTKFIELFDKDLKDEVIYKKYVQLYRQIAR